MYLNLLAATERVFGAAVVALAFTIFTGVSPVQAQQEGTIAGTVTAEGTGEPLNGAQVFIEGTEFGTLTGEDGAYSMEGVPAGDYTVSVRLIGYQGATETVSVPAGETVTANFSVEIAPVALDELVTTFTGEQRRRQVGVSVGDIDADDLAEKSEPANITDLLKGRTTGVSVQRSSGTVGTGSTVKVRGITSFGNNTPMVIVDGAIYNNSNELGSGQSGQNFTRLTDINPEDIQSVEVVKGPSAAALYGTEAAAGVLVITTRQGEAGDARFTLRGQGGINRDDSDFATVGFTPQSAALFGPAATDTVYTMNLLEDPDLSPFRDGVIQKYGGNVRGGAEDVSYYVSGEFQDEEGVLPQNGLTQYNVRGNFSIDPSETVDISVSNGYTSGFTNLPQNDNNGFGYIGIAQIGSPWAQSITRDDPVTGETVDTCPLNFEAARLLGAPVSVIDEQVLGPCPDNPFFAGRTFDDVATLVSDRDSERYTGSGTLTWRPIDLLTNRVTVGYDAFSEQQDILIPVDPDLPFGSFSEGDKFTVDRQSRNLTLEGTSALDLQISDDWSSSTTAGVQYFREVLESSSCTGQVLPQGTTTCGNAVTTQGGEAYAETRTAGFFVQEQLGWRDRLYITPAIRFDDNSAFGENLGLTVYPSFNASYAIGEEEWFPEFFDQFRLRGGYGQAGQQPGSLDAFRLLDPTRVTFLGSDAAGVSPTDPGNPDLKPQKAEEFEGGFDLGILDNRVGLEATYYHQNTNDAIVNRPLAPSLGFPDTRPVNVGQLRNRGLELGLDALAVAREDVRWTWEVNFTTIDNEVTELDAPIIFGLGGSSQRHAEGLPVGSYVSEPVFINDAGEVEVGEEQLIGQPTPEIEGAVSTTLTLFETVTLYGLLDYALGHQLFNNTEEFHCGFLGGGVPAEQGGGICLSMLETGPDGEFTDEARIRQEASRIGSEAPFVYDADYAKLRTISARVELPGQWARAVGAAGASITLLGENLATFTDYPGADPEINFGGQDDFTRAEFLTLPVQQRFLGTISVTF